MTDKRLEGRISQLRGVEKAQRTILKNTVHLAYNHLQPALERRVSEQRPSSYQHNRNRR